MNQTRIRFASVALLPALFVTGALSGRAAEAQASTEPGGSGHTVLGVEGARFTRNGRPEFLLGFSYYGALGAPEDFIRQDLADFERRSFHWLRVWATWSAGDHDVSAVDAQGLVREPYFAKLRWLIAECDRRGLVVDVTLTRGQEAPTVPAGGRLLTFEAHQRAVETLVQALRPHRNWYLDLANERDVRDGRYVSAWELKQLRQRVRMLDPERLVTASFGGYNLSERDVREAVREIGLDFLAVHRPRTAESPSQTEARTRACLALMRTIGRVVPVHHQEPFRRGYGEWEPTAADFLMDLRGAYAGGAAGWCFHNGSQRDAPDHQPRRSFDLRGRRLFDQLDDEERQVVERAADPLRPLPRLKVSENRRFLITEAGEPFFWLGDTAWWIRQISPADVDLYLSNRVHHRFNVIQVHCGYNVKDHAGNRPFLNDDVDRPNEAFWRTIDAIVSKAQEHGLYVALVPIWGDEYAKAFGTDAEKAYRFGKWLGQRYASQDQILWIVSGEYDSINGFRLPISEAQRDVLTAAARGLRAAHGGTQLMTIHPGVARTSSRDFHKEPWLDFNMLQSGHMINSESFRKAENYTLIANDYGLDPPKPVLDGEPIYEDTPDGVWVYRDISHPRADAAAVRRKAYWAVFAGAFGHTYGHNTVYGYFEARHPGDVVTLPEGPGQRGGWKAALDAPGAIQMKHLRALMESRPVLTRLPDPTLLAVSSPPGLDHVAALRASDGSYAMIYVPRGKPVSVVLSRLAGHRLGAWWFDPRTGTAQRADEFEPHGVREFTPPGAGPDQDWVLVLDDVAKAYPIPGTPLGSQRVR
jgi:hypothetical protein